MNGSPDQSSQRESTVNLLEQYEYPEDLFSGCISGSASIIEYKVFEFLNYQKENIKKSKISAMLPEGENELNDKWWIVLLAIFEFIYFPHRFFERDLDRLLDWRHAKSKGLQKDVDPNKCDIGFRYTSDHNGVVKMGFVGMDAICALVERDPEYFKKVFEFIYHKRQDFHPSWLRILRVAISRDKDDEKDGLFRHFEDEWNSSYGVSIMRYDEEKSKWIFDEEDRMENEECYANDKIIGFFDENYYDRPLPPKGLLHKVKILIALRCEPVFRVAGFRRSLLEEFKKKYPKDFEGKTHSECMQYIWELISNPSKNKTAYNIYNKELKKFEKIDCVPEVLTKLTGLKNLNRDVIDKAISQLKKMEETRLRMRTDYGWQYHGIDISPLSALETLHRP